MARGNRRKDIFLVHDDRRFFLHALRQAGEMTGWQEAAEAALKSKAAFRSEKIREALRAGIAAYWENDK